MLAGESGEHLDLAPRAELAVFREEQTTVTDSSGYPIDPASTYPVAEIAAAWGRERPGVPTTSIAVVTPIWRLAKLLADDRRRVLRDAGIDPATLDLLGVLRRSGAPYRLTTRELIRRSLVSAGAISQRLARAEGAGLITRSGSTAHPRAVDVALTRKGHRVIEHAVDKVLSREASLTDGLDDTQRRDLARLLDLLDHQVRRQLADDANR